MLPECPPVRRDSGHSDHRSGNVDVLCNRVLAVRNRGAMAILSCPLPQPRQAGVLQGWGGGGGGVGKGGFFFFVFRIFFCLFFFLFLGVVFAVFFFEGFFFDEVLCV